VVHVQRTFSVTPDPATVVDYLADFSRAEQWGPGTKTCTTTSTGPVGVGSTWHNVSEVKGKETELDYELTVLEPDHLTFVEQNKTATSVDDITVVADGTGSSITCDSNITFHGLAKLADPFMHNEFEKLGDETVESMTTTPQRPLNQRPRRGEVSSCRPCAS